MFCLTLPELPNFTCAISEGAGGTVHIPFWIPFWTKRIVELRNYSSPSIMFWILLILSLPVDTSTLSFNNWFSNLIE